MPGPLVAIVGAPNVGKSTLFNRMVGRRHAIVTDQPGVTRDRLYGDVDRDPLRFRLVDTGGLTPNDAAPFADAQTAAITETTATIPPEITPETAPAETLLDETQTESATEPQAETTPDETQTESATEPQTETTPDETQTESATAETTPAEQPNMTIPASGCNRV